MALLTQAQQDAIYKQRLAEKGQPKPAVTQTGRPLTAQQQAGRAELEKSYQSGMAEQGQPANVSSNLADIYRPPKTEPITPAPPKYGAKYNVAGTQVSQTYKGTTYSSPEEAANARRVSMTADGVTRAPATVPTSSEPLRTFGEGAKPDFAVMSDTDKMIEIGLKRAKGQQLSDDELRYVIGQQLKPADTGMEAGLQKISDTLTGQITAQEESLKARKGEMETERERLIRQEGERQQALFEQQKGEAITAGERESQAVQGALSFSGFGRSTYNAGKQGEIQENVTKTVQQYQAAKDMQMELFKRQLEGADEETLQSMQQGINDLRTQAQQFELDSAVKVADLNMKNQVNAVDAINNVLQTLGPQSSTGSQVDEGLTKLISDGYLYRSDENGMPVRVQDYNGNEIKTGVQASDASLQYIPPLQSPLTGSLITPAYTFDKKTGQLIAVTSGPQGYKSEVIEGATAETMQTYKNFDSYISGTGNGRVVTGSPYHKGLEVDIDGKIGDPIKAFIGGEIVKVQTSKESGGYGNSVIVKDANGNTYRYAHLNGMNVTVGQQVNAGGLLGTMGNTGNVIGGKGGDGSHLHIEAKGPDGKLISLTDIAPEQTYSTAYSDSMNEEYLAAEAVMKGYSGNEIAGYINARKQGANPSDKTSIERQKAERETSLEVGKAVNDVTQQFLQQPITKNYIEVKTNLDFVNKINPDTASATDKMALIYTFARVMDPSSAVREGEYASVGSNARSYVESLAINAEKVFNNPGELQPSHVRKLLVTLNNKYDSFIKQYEGLKKGYGQQVDNLGISEYLGGQKGISILEGSLGDLGQVERSTKSITQADIDLFNSL